MTDWEYARQSRRLDALNASLDRKPTPVELPNTVVDQTGRRRDTDNPVPVKARIPVSYAYTELLELDGEVIAWTDKAVLVRTVITPGTEPRHVWVWANAVTRK